MYFPGHLQDLLLFLDYHLLFPDYSLTDPVIVTGMMRVSTLIQESIIVPSLASHKLKHHKKHQKGYPF